jgi:hypothetical protein
MTNFHLTCLALIQETLQAALDSMTSLKEVKESPVFQRMNRAEKIRHLDALLNRLALVTNTAKALKVELQNEDKKKA